MSSGEEEISRQERWLAAIFAALLLIVILLLANVWVALNVPRSPPMLPMMGMMNSNPSGKFASNGERIFKTGTNAGGQVIPNSMMMGMGGCAMCHGLDGRGGQMMGRTEPCNTFNCLKAAGYSEDTIKRAVSQGIAADGHQLDFMMPRWQLAETDLDDLIVYLKTLP